MKKNKKDISTKLTLIRNYLINCFRKSVYDDDVTDIGDYFMESYPEIHDAVIYLESNIDFTELQPEIDSFVEQHVDNLMKKLKIKILLNLIKSNGKETS